MYSNYSEDGSVELVSEMYSNYSQDGGVVAVSEAERAPGEVGVAVQTISNVHYYKLYAYMIISALTLAECVLIGYLTFLSIDLRQKVSTWFTNSMVLTIGAFSLLSLSLALVLLTVSNATYKSPWACWVRVVQRYLSAVSCYQLVCLALDRYLFICWPLRYYGLVTRKLCHALCIACWVVPVFLLLMPCVRQLPTMCHDGRTNKVFLISYSVAYTLGALASLVFYLLVALEFRGGCRGVKTEVNHDEVVWRRVARSTLRVLMLYTVLSLPHTLLPLLSRMVAVHPTLVDIGHLVHRIHLLLFLPVYAFACNTFLVSLRAWGRFLVHWATCRSSGGTNRREPPTAEMSITHHSLANGV